MSLNHHCPEARMDPTNLIDHERGGTDRTAQQGAHARTFAGQMQIGPDGDEPDGDVFGQWWFSDMYKEPTPRARKFPMPA